MALPSDWQVVEEAMRLVRADRCTPGKLADAEVALARLIERERVLEALVETLRRLLDVGGEAAVRQRKPDLTGQAGTALEAFPRRTVGTRRAKAQKRGAERRGRRSHGGPWERGVMGSGARRRL
jgi:hypothetical protein